MLATKTMIDTPKKTLKRLSVLTTMIEQIKGGFLDI